MKLIADLKGEVDNNTVISRDFRTLLSVMNRLFRQKINKETLELIYTLESRHKHF